MNGLGENKWRKWAGQALLVFLIASGLTMVCAILATWGSVDVMDSIGPWFIVVAVVAGLVAIVCWVISLFVRSRAGKLRHSGGPTDG